MRATDANAGVLAMGKNPSVKVWRQATLIPNVAPVWIIGIPVLVCGHLNDFVVGQYPGRLFGIGDGGTGDGGSRTIGANHTPSGDRLGAGIVVFSLIGHCH